MIPKREISPPRSGYTLMLSRRITHLAGHSQEFHLTETWVFKGGTCLKKCYFETYRFSEDLDFTLRNEAHIHEDFLHRAFGEISEWERTGLELPVDSQSYLREPTRQTQLSGKAQISWSDLSTIRRLAQARPYRRRTHGLAACAGANLSSLCAY